MTKRHFYFQFKLGDYVALQVLACPPIMIMASISDQRAFKKEREQRKKAQEQNR